MKICPRFMVIRNDKFVIQTLKKQFHCQFFVYSRKSQDFSPAWCFRYIVTLFMSVKFKCLNALIGDTNLFASHIKRYVSIFLLLTKQNMLPNRSFIEGFKI